jgi:putative transposase
LTDEGTLDAALDCLLEHIPLEMEGGYTCQDLFEILLRAASRRDSIEHTAQRLEGVPSGNGIRYHLDKLDDMGRVEHDLNAALQSRIPPKVRRGRHCIAIDLHLIPYYGNASEAEAP